MRANSKVHFAVLSTNAKMIRPACLPYWQETMSKPLRLVAFHRSVTCRGCQRTLAYRYTDETE